MHYIIAMLGGLVMGVYWDATKHKVGKIPDESARHNFSAARWALLSVLFVPGVVYLLNRRQLHARAAEHPVESTHVGRNKVLLACTTGFLVFVFSLAGEGGSIALVKGGVLDVDPRTTVGEAFDNYSYFRSCSWACDQTANGMQFVNVIGEVDTDQLKDWKNISDAGVVKVLAMFQFTLNRDGVTFQYNAFDVQGLMEDGSIVGIRDLLEQQRDILAREGLTTTKMMDEDTRLGSLLGSVPGESRALEVVYSNEPLFYE